MDAATTEQAAFALDTDIGSDVDDLLALAVALGSPELALTGVTTVYGDVLLRARMVRRALRTAGAPPLPVVPGRAEPRSGAAVWWAGHEGGSMPGLDEEPVQADRDAPALLAESPVVVAIGPLTNVAEAVETQGHRIRRIVLMGGAFPGRAEHNIVSDVDAAQAVFRSGVPVTAIGLDQTERVWLAADALDRIEAVGRFGALLAAEMRQWWRYTESDSNVPHDPLAVLLLAQPGLFTLNRGHVRVDAGGRTEIEPSPAGPHAVVSDLAVPVLKQLVVDRILAAARA